MIRQDPRRRSATLRGFTLIELLVVISIIVVLLALLAPALDRALAEAELAACAASFDVITTGAQVYAVAHNRKYPITQPRRGTARQLKQGAIDMRPVLEPYFSINDALNDPLVGEVDYVAIPDNSWAWTGRDWFFGYGFNGSKPMNKIGARLEATVTEYDGTQRDYVFTIIAGDRNSWWGTQVIWNSTHPDSDGILEEVVLQSAEDRPAWEAGNSTESQAGTVASTGTEGTGAIDRLTTSLLWITGTDTRGTLDLNWAHEDGSVNRYSDIEMHDDRLKRIPQARSRANYPDLTLRIPSD